MNKRYVVLLLSGVLALAMAVPAIGGPSNPIADGAASAKKTAKKALKKAKKANRKAKTAQAAADSAQTAADAAQATANSADTAASGAQSSADAAAAAASAAQATADAAAADAAVNTAAKLGQEDVFNSSADNPTDAKVVSAVCPSGKTVTGGWGFTDGTNNVALTGLLKFYEDTSALAEEMSPVGTNWQVSAQASCIND